MNIIKLLKDNPLSAIVIKQWFLDKMIESFKSEKNIPEEYRQQLIEAGVSEDMLERYVQNNPNVLFEIFDNNEIFIEILRKKSQFTFDINQAQTENKYFLKRKDAEAQAAIQTIIILENKLNTQQQNGKS